MMEIIHDGGYGMVQNYNLGYDTLKTLIFRLKKHAASEKETDRDRDIDRYREQL